MSFFYRIRRQWISRLLDVSKVILLACLVLQPKNAKAQENPWIIGLYTYSNSSITYDVLSLGSGLLNALIAEQLEGAASIDLNLINYHYLKVKDNGETVDYKQNNPYGFTSYDLFNNVEIGLKLGWQGPESPFGAFVYGAYGINQYKFRFLGEREYSKHKMQSVRLGLGIRISPLHLFVDPDDLDWYPYIDIGTTYVNNFSYKGPYSSDKSQINNGFRSSYALGVKMEGFFVAICMDMAHYDLFNKDYTPDDGYWFPYANFKSKDMNFSIRLGIDLWKED